MTLVTTIKTAPAPATGGSTTQTITKAPVSRYGGLPVPNTAYNAAGGVIANSGTATSAKFPIHGGRIIRITAAEPIRVYGFTYDAQGNSLGAFRDVSLFDTKTKEYTFTAPAAATQMSLYLVVNGEDARALRLSITGTGPAETRQVAYPINPRNFSGSTIQKLDACTELLLWLGGGVLEVDEPYLLSRAFFIPSYTHLKFTGRGGFSLASGARDNVIRNYGIRDPQNIQAVPDEFITISGGYIEGTYDDWGSDGPAGVDGQSWRAIGLLLGNVENYTIDGLRVIETNMWGISQEQCRYGTLRNINFEQGHAHLNQDGIDVRLGCHDLKIENISGRTFDDMVALTNLVVRDDLHILSTTIYEPGRTELDIYNISIDTLKRRFSSFFGPQSPFPHQGGGVLLLCEDGRKIHNVTVRNVHGGQQILLGYPGYTASTEATVDDMYNITIEDVSTAPIFLRRPVKNCSFVRVPALAPNGTTPSAALVAGSRNIERKYHGQDREFLTTV